jgi:ferrochelatase
MDPRVIDIAAWKRSLIVNLFILPFRPKQSAEAYSQIWTDEGSPLLVHGLALADRVRARLGSGIQVELAMRYGKPSIATALARFRESGVQRIVVFPLYPQYSSATTGSTIERVFEEAGRQWNTPFLQVAPPFYEHAAFLEAAAGAARPVIERVRPEKVFMSFHGLPERQILKGDESGRHCLTGPDCCGSIGDMNRDCYRAQCFATARSLAERLELDPDRQVVCFQSRLGRDPWIRPYTEEVLVEHARQGCKRAVILSPAFVADCLETLEELGIRGAELWKQHGGELLELAPAPNADDEWADAVVTIARESSRWLDPE